MSELRRDSWTTSIFCLLLGGFILADTFTYPAVQGQGFGQGPGFYPQLLAGVLIFLGGLILIREFVSSRAEIVEHGPAKPSVRYLPVVLLNALSIILIFLMKYLGFFVSGFLLIILTVFLIRRQTNMKLMCQDLMFSFGMIFLVYLVFEIFVGIELPTSIFLD
jgi:Tripartite tricarboxylate transporter TctB family